MTNQPLPPDLARLRDQIEKIDRELIELIAERVKLARAVGETKHAAGMPTLDHAREASVVRRVVESAREAGLPYDEEIRQIFWQIIGLCRRAQTQDGG